MKTRTIAYTGVLTALVVGLQFLSNYVTFGPVSINLALIPIAVGAILFGPYIGLFLGLVDGAIVLAAPSTLSIFFSANPAGTIFVCLFKTGLAGFMAGWVNLWIKKKSSVTASVTASLLIPIINTGIFSAFLPVLFHDFLVQVMTAYNQNAFTAIFVSIVTWNFFVEFGVVALLSPIIVRVIQIFEKTHQKEN